MLEALAPGRQPTAADLVGGLPHGVALEAGDLGDLPAEEPAVEGRACREVADRDVDVRDVSVCHPPSMAPGWDSHHTHEVNGRIGPRQRRPPTGPTRS